MGRLQDGHLTIRCSSEQAARIRKAAQRRKQSLTGFLLEAALKECVNAETSITAVSQIGGTASTGPLNFRVVMHG